MKLDEDLGWIYFLGVDLPWRGGGLAAALGASGLRWASERGARLGVLYVDEDNETAVRLYRRLGFEVEHEDRCYEIDVPPA